MTEQRIAELSSRRELSNPWNCHVAAQKRYRVSTEGRASPHLVHASTHAIAHGCTVTRKQTRNYKQGSLGEICDLVKTHWGTSGSD